MWQCAIVLICGLILQGCGSDVEVYQVPKTSPKTSGMDMSAMNNDGMAGHQHRPLDFDLPEGWKELPASGMRLISISVAVDGGSLDGSVVKLGTAAGDVVSNVNRWRGQVGLSDATEKEITAELKVDESALGSFQIFKMINPDKPESAILAAMYHLDDAVVFAKLMGPSEGLLAQEAAFLKFCKSLKPHQH